MRKLRPKGVKPLVQATWLRWEVGLDRGLGLHVFKAHTPNHQTNLELCGWSNDWMFALILHPRL